MGGLNRRGFLKAITALAGSLTLPAAALVSQPKGAAGLFEWKWEYFDRESQLGVCASLVGPDGVTYRHAVRVFLPFRGPGDRPLTGDPRVDYPKEFAECKEHLALWAESKWAA